MVDGSDAKAFVIPSESRLPAVALCEGGRDLVSHSLGMTAVLA